MEVGVGVAPEVGEGHLLHLRPRAHAPALAQPLQGEAHVVAAVLEYSGNRFVQQSASKLALSLGDKLDSVVRVLETVQPYSEVRALGIFLGERGDPQGLEGGGGVGRLAHQREGREALRDQVDHVEVQLGVHRAVDVFLAEGDEVAPGHGLLVVLARPKHAQGPVALPQGGAVGQRHDHRLPELLGGLHRAADDDGGEQGLAVRHLGVGLGVVHHADVHVLGLTGGQRALGDGQADVGLREGDPRPRGGHRGPLGEHSLREAEA